MSMGDGQVDLSAAAAMTTRMAMLQMHGNGLQTSMHQTSCP